MAEDNSNNKTRQLLLLGAVVFSVVGVLIATSVHGLGYNTDSFSYLLGAEALSAEGVMTSEYSLVHFPPLLPALLIAIGTTHTALILAFSVVLLIVNMGLLALMLQSAGVQPLIQVGFVLAMGLSPVMLILHGILHSEPLFFVLLQLALILLVSGRYRWALIVVALAPLQRYAGVSLIATAALYIVLRSGWKNPAAWGRALVFGGLSTIPVALWILRNTVVSESAGREIGFRWMGWDRLVQAGVNLAPWLLPLLVICGVLFALTRHRPKMPEIVKLSLLFMMIYSAFLLVSIHLFDHFTPLDYRILSPMILLGGLCAVWFIDAQLRALHTQQIELPLWFPSSLWLKRGLALLLLGYMVLGLGYAITRREGGLGMVRALRPIHYAVLEAIPTDTLLYSNQEHLVSMMGRQAISPPSNLYELDDDPQYYAGMERMIEQIAAGQAVILWFEDFNRTQIAGPEELSTLIPYHETHERLIVFANAPVLQ